MEVNISPRIIVQGGAYSQMLGDLTKEYKRATKESAKEGYAVLMNGGTAVDAVEAAVRVLEDNEDFNAGRGSLLSTESEVECDAMIMDGHTLDNGAVITGRWFRNPVGLAKKIMEESPHCALSGEGALRFAELKNFPICDPEELITQRATELNVKYPDYDAYVRHHYKGEPVMESQKQEAQDTVSEALDTVFPALQITVSEAQDTVSAVAMDANGHLACATSTGGIPGKFKGRVSDAPLVGCGGYANEHGAATTTGHGESLIKMTLAREVVYNIESGQNAQESAKNALQKMEDRLNVYGHGGVIAIDQHGNFGKAFNTAMMVWASIEDNKLESGMEKDGKDESEQLSLF